VDDKLFVGIVANYHCGNRGLVLVVKN